MKTVFKEGMKVYDQMFFPDVEGKIIKVHNKNDKIQLEVKFFSKYRLEPLCMQSSVFYTENGNMINFLGYNCGTSTLSTSPYNLEMQGFEQKAPVKTYEDAIKWLESTEGTEIMNDSVFLSEGNYYTNLNTCAEALKKLILLRDYYNEGWQPDWSKKNKMHFCIRVRNNKITKDSNSDINEFNAVLVFSDYTIRDKFLEEQRELLEIAKPLL